MDAYVINKVFPESVRHLTFSQWWWWRFFSSEIWCIVDRYKGESMDFPESGGSKVLRNQCERRKYPRRKCSLFLVNL